MQDKLVIISSENWLSLRDLYLKDWPSNCIGYYTIDNFIRWHKINPNIKNLQFYSLNDDWTDGTFLIVDRYQLFFNTLNSSYHRLRLALSLLDWTNGFKCSSFHENHHSVVHDIVKMKQLKTEYDSITCVYHLSREKAKEFVVSPPPGIILKKLSEEDAVIAESIWPNRHVGSIFFLKRLARWNPNIGAYTADTGKLLGWCLLLQSGALGAFQVIDERKGCGLGTLICTAICKQLADLNMDITAFVNKDNTPSVKTFEKLGFVQLHDGYWLRTYPTVPFTWTDDENEE